MSTGVGASWSPRSPAETTTILIHYFRAEVGRMTGWRDRLDRTSNWAITVAAATLSISLSTPDSHHGIVLFAMLVISLLLWIEARRYRFFDVYRARVRLLERNYFAQVLSPAQDATPEWSEELARSLRAPRFLMGHLEAVSRRLRRNYIWMYLILLLAWVLKISSPRLQDDASSREAARTLNEILSNAALGSLPGWLVLGAVAMLYGALLFVTLRVDPDDGELAHGEVHV
jgi:uncharacterized membrane protein